MLDYPHAIDRIANTLRVRAQLWLKQTLTISRSQPAMPEAPLAPRYSITEQWARVIGVLELAQGQASHVVSLQREAAAELDAATYALQKLREEIAPAFSLSPAFRERPLPVTAFREPFRRRQPLAA